MYDTENITARFSAYSGAEEKVMREIESMRKEQAENAHNAKCDSCGESCWIGPKLGASEAQCSDCAEEAGMNWAAYEEFNQ